MEAHEVVTDPDRLRPAVGLPFGSFPQQSLAFAFVLARCGDGEARGALDEYVRTYEVDAETAAKLEELLERTAAA